MKAKDLRIGNLLHTLEDKLTSVTEIITAKDLETIYFWCYNYNESQCKPIELTEEWLIKFGLVSLCVTNEVKWLFTFGGDFDCYFNVFGRNEISIEQYSEGCLELEHIKYVHQLQNLYFALTGKELEIR